MGQAESQAAELIRGGRADLAETILTSQLANDAENAEAHRLMAHCLLARRALEQALVEAREALRLDADSWPCHYTMAVALRWRRRLDEAEREVAEAIRISGGTSALFALLAGIHLDAGKRREAIRDARAGLSINPQDQRCLENLALALLLDNRIAEARRIIHEALRDDPSEARLHYQLGVALFHLGMYSQATCELSETLRLNPRQAKAEDNLRLAWRYAINTHVPDPYRPRFGFFWNYVPTRKRLGSLAGMSTLGLIWPGLWGAMALPLGLELARWSSAWTFLPKSIRRDLGIFVLLGVLGMLLLLVSLTSGILLELITGTLPHQDHRVATAGEAEFVLHSVQVLTGLALFWTVAPILLTRGRALALALAIGSLAVVLCCISMVAGGSVLPLPAAITDPVATIQAGVDVVLHTGPGRGPAAPFRDNTSADICICVAFGMFVLAYLAQASVFWVERRGWARQGDVPSVPPPRWAPDDPIYGAYRPPGV